MMEIKIYRVYSLYYFYFTALLQRSQPIPEILTQVDATVIILTAATIAIMGRGRLSHLFISILTQLTT